MNSTRTIALIALLAPLTVGCASSTYEGNNNTHVLNNNNPGVDGSTSTCAATCSGDNVCIGQPGHETCVPTCIEGLTCADPLRTCCYGGCVDLQSDFNNCGSCAEFCDGTCNAGDCRDACDNQCDPSANEVCCGGLCVDTMTDMSNCGSCENVCNSEGADACVNGSCKCGSLGQCDVASMSFCCDSQCAFYATDFNNCGGCGAGFACTIGETCDGGNCLCGTGPACGSTQSCCDQSCVDTNTPQYCGSCTNACGTNEGCYSGTCGCGGAGVVCQDLMGGPLDCCPTGCQVLNGVNLFAPLENCGTCNTTCPAGVPCVFGLCDPT